MDVKLNNRKTKTIDKNKNQRIEKENINDENNHAISSLINDKLDIIVRPTNLSSYSGTLTFLHT